MTDVSLLSALALSAFTSATILPGTSDAAFAALLWQKPELAWAALLIAGAFNSLGSITSYALGRIAARHYRARISPKALTILKRYGANLLFFSWLPVIGDALPLAAGYLRLSVWHCVLAITAGKFLRYGIIMTAVY
ncbi:YqaA family protein [Suttonella indologenes]|uniref:Inner membrane protein yqaA n=1 Tax=Suttonella indologenes TaxID=13276 RepID=A0A380MKH9_9GAMM|nr:VTT domain-containing protein [Suttonella indologenes]SUO92604.1 Inner membrane protein yqaA [Suttonella indologenes]